LSFLLALDGGRLRLDKREDSTACDDDPARWVLSPAALTFVR
jgi:hypothetical protein